MTPNSAAEASVFTTLRWKNSGHVAWLPYHLTRIRAHAERLGIEWPSDIEMQISELQPVGEGNLCSIRLTREGHVNAELRISEYSESPLSAISIAAPRWDSQILGTKHADWEAYTDARRAAQDKGADISLLVHDGAVIDGDRCTPIILDADGIAYAPILTDGGVDSISLGIVIDGIEKAGIPFRRARLTEMLIGRSHELIVVGTGVGVAWLNQFDGQQIGSGSPGPLFTVCNDTFHSELSRAWTTLGGES